MSTPVISSSETFDCRVVFAEELLALARTDERIADY